MTTIDQLTQDIAAAQAEIARLSEHLTNCLNTMYKAETRDKPILDVNYLNACKFLSKKSPSTALQEYRDKVIEECAEALWSDINNLVSKLTVSAWGTKELVGLKKSITRLKS